MDIFFRLFFLLIISAFCHAQQKWDVNAVIDKVEHYYTTEGNYGYSLEYRFFENQSSTKTADQYAGQILKRGKVIYQKVNKVESVNFGDCIVSLNRTEKTFALMNTKSRTSPIALKYLLQTCSQNKLTSSKQYWICELRPGTEQQKQFKKAVIYVNKKDFSLHKQVFYTEGSQEIEKNNTVMILKNPRIEILYKENSKSFAGNTQAVDRAYYLSVKNKKSMPSKRFQKYKLITQ